MKVIFSRPIFLFVFIFIWVTAGLAIVNDLSQYPYINGILCAIIAALGGLIISTIVIFLAWRLDGMDNHL
jgi:hypothetical protein